MTQPGRRIWIINQFASTPKTNTGAGERFYHLGHRFAKEGCDVTVFAGAYNHLFLHPPHRRFPGKVESQGGGMRFVWLWVNRYRPESGLGRLINWISFVFSFACLRKNQWGAPDVVVLSSMSLWPVLNVWWLKRRYPGVKFVFEVRDMWPLTPVMMGGISRRNPVVRIMFALEKMALRMADAFVSVLPHADLRLQEVLADDKKRPPFFWIPNGIDVALAASDVKPKEKMQDQPFEVVYTGALGKANAMEYVVGAARIMQNAPVRFTIVGDGPEKSALERQCSGLTNCRFIGKVGKEKVQAYLKQADAAVISWRNLTLYRYGVSANKYNDYMLASKPVVSASAFPFDPVQQAKCGIRVVPESDRAIAEGIRCVMQADAEQRRQWGEAGRQYLLRHQVYDVLAGKYLNVFEQILNDQ